MGKQPRAQALRNSIQALMRIYCAVTGKWAIQIGVLKVRVAASGSRRAATDRRRDPRDRYRSMTDPRTGQAVAASFTCGFLMIFTGL